MLRTETPVESVKALCTEKAPRWRMSIPRAAITLPAASSGQCSAKCDCKRAAGQSNARAWCLMPPRLAYSDCTCISSAGLYNVFEHKQQSAERRSGAEHQCCSLRTSTPCACRGLCRLCLGAAEDSTPVRARFRAPSSPCQVAGPSRSAASSRHRPGCQPASFTEGFATITCVPDQHQHQQAGCKVPAR